MIEAMSDGGVRMGLPRATATRLAPPLPVCMLLKQQRRDQQNLESCECTPLVQAVATVAAATAEAHQMVDSHLPAAKYHRRLLSILCSGVNLCDNFVESYIHCF